MSQRLTYGLPWDATDEAIDAQLLEAFAKYGDAEQRRHWLCMERSARNAMGSGHAIRCLEARARNPAHAGARCYDTRAGSDGPPRPTPAPAPRFDAVPIVNAAPAWVPTFATAPPVDHARLAREQAERDRRAEEEAELARIDASARKFAEERNREERRRDKAREETPAWYRQRAR